MNKCEQKAATQKQITSVKFFLDHRISRRSAQLLGAAW